MTHPTGDALAANEKVVEAVARAMDDFEMPDGDPFGVLIFNSEYVLPSNRMDMIEQKAVIIRSVARAAIEAYEKAMTEGK